MPRVLFTTMLLTHAARLICARQATRLFATNIARNPNTLKLALCQVSVTADKFANIDKVRETLLEACQHPTDVLVLPEIWNSPYATGNLAIMAPF
jgi:hypothetical protein